MDVKNALRLASLTLAPQSETATLDAQVLLAHLLGNSRAWLAAHSGAPLSAVQERQLEAALARLESGEPLPYVLGRWEFYGLEFKLNPATLIPRPETELLVETALSWLRERPERLRAAEAGTGSGCIAVALAVHHPALRLAATDVSRMALQAASQNANRHQTNRTIDFVQADLLAPLTGPFDLICANLPYVPSRTLEQLRVAQSEPRLALDGGPDGLDLIRRLLEQAPDRLAPGGRILLEIEASQGQPAAALAQAVFPKAAVRTLVDLAGHDRLLVVDQPP